MHTFNGKTLGPALALATLLGAPSAEAARIYVNAQSTSPAPDGTSWASAFGSLQDALTTAAGTAEGDEIWVARGAYVPTKIYAPGGVTGGASGLNTPHLRTFDLPDRVAIYGGFRGNETSLGQRAPATNETVLSGGGVSWHVVTAGDDVAGTGVDATLDGLTIREGNAQGPSGGSTLFGPFAYDHDYGGGLYAAFGSVINVNNVRFLDNVAAQDGGGAFSINSMLTVTWSYFAHNSSSTRGGALEVFNTFETTSHAARIANTVFDGNTTGVFGGAIVGEGTFPDENSSLEIDASVFRNNTAPEGGAVVFDSQRTLVRNSLFDHNVATVNAGALATTNVVDTIVNTVFYGPDHPFTKFATTVSNCTFNGNVALGDQAAHDAMLGGAAALGLDFAVGGGALVAYMNGYLDVSDSSFYGNTAQNGDGGAILNGRAAAQNTFGATAYDVRTTVVNSDFNGNAAPQGNGGAIASLPDGAYTIPERTVANTTLSVTGSTLRNNSTNGNGGAIYLDLSTATLGANLYAGNRATLGLEVYGLDSIINGSSLSPYVLDR